MELVLDAGGLEQLAEPRALLRVLPGKSSTTGIPFDSSDTMSGVRAAFSLAEHRM